MKTSKNIFLLLLAFATLTVYGQNHLIGVKSGVSWTNVTTSNLFISTNFRTGFNVGLSYDYIFKRNFIFGADFLYNQYGFKNGNTLTDNLENPTGQNVIMTFNYNYLTMPLKVGFHYGKTFYRFGNIGLTPAILIDAKSFIPEIKTDEIFLPSERHNTTDRVNKFDIGGIVEVGCGYKFEDRFWLFTSLSYQQSFTTITITDYFANSKIRHNGLTINLGLKYALTKD